MKRKIVVIGLLAMLCAVLTFTIPVDQAQAKSKTVQIRLVVPAPPGDWPLTYVCEQLAKGFNERVKEGYTMEVFAGGAVAVLPEYFNALRVGAVEMALAPWTFYAFMDQRLGLIETPFILNNNEAAVYASKKFLPLYDELLQEKKFNQKALGLMGLNGLEVLATKPVKTLEDWKGLLVGSLGSVSNNLVKDLGGAPTVIPWPDFYQSLQKGVIDAVANGTHGSINTGLHDVCKNVTLFYGLCLWNGWSINLDIWKNMPPEVQNILQEEVNKQTDWMHSVMKEMDEKDYAELRKKNVEIYKLPTKERERWVQALIPFREKQLSSEFGQKISKIADEANKKFPYTAEY